MKAQLKTKIGNFEAGRMGDIVESPFEKMALATPENSDVPKRELVENELLFFQPTLAANESAELRGTIIPVQADEVEILKPQGEAVNLTRAEYFALTKIVSMHVTQGTGTEEEFEAAVNKLEEFREAHSETADRYRDHIISLSAVANGIVATHVGTILEAYDLPEGTEDWDRSHIVSFLEGAAAYEGMADLLSVAILRRPNTAPLFDFIEDAFVNGQ